MIFEVQNEKDAFYIFGENESSFLSKLKITPCEANKDDKIMH